MKNLKIISVLFMIFLFTASTAIAEYCYLYAGTYLFTKNKEEAVELAEKLKKEIFTSEGGRVEVVMLYLYQSFSKGKKIKIIIVYGLEKAMMKIKESDGATITLGNVETSNYHVLIVKEIHEYDGIYILNVMETEGDPEQRENLYREFILVVQGNIILNQDSYGADYFNSELLFFSLFKEM